MPPELGCKHALLLQGPPGPFFRQLAAELADAGVRVDKVNFHAGDELFYPDDAIAYRGSADAWPDFFQQLVAERGIDAVLLFGDCRPVHKAAIARARALGVAVWVFEEGYLRPDFITLEPGGVNGYSRLTRDPAFYLQQAAALPTPLPPEPVGQSFPYHAYYSARYAVAQMHGAERFPGYQHHRPLDPWMHGAGWLRGFLKKPWLTRHEQPLLGQLTGSYDPRYFLVPLQVHADYQIIEHSSFDTIEETIEQVVRSFAAHAPGDTLLVLKHHPMDRGYREYGDLIRQLARELGLRQRLLSVHDLHLPTLLRHARGVITVNSTVGLSAIHHGAPVKVLGNAVYDMPGLTNQGTLEQFWVEQEPPDPRLYRAFARFLRWTSQHNGNFYRPLSARGTGVRWVPSSLSHLQAIPGALAAGHSRT